MNFKRYLIANIRDVRVLVRQFRTSLFLFVIVVLLGALILKMLYVSPESGKRLSYMEALYATFNMVFFEQTLSLPENWLLRIFFLAVPVLGLGLIADGVVRFGVMLFNKQARREEWQVAVASTFKGHIVVCGLGRVGYRVVKQLLDFGEEVVAVERNREGPFVEAIMNLGVPVIIADARHRETLVKAGVERASAIVACTQDDLTNLDISLDARELNPEIKVVMRMFDAELARKVEKGFGLHTAFSTSALAAPAFAAAAAIRANISYSFYVGDVLLNVAEMEIKPGSPLAGKTVAELEKELELSVIFYKGRDKVDLHPAPNICLEEGDKIVIFASLDVLHKCYKLNQPKEWKV